MDFVARFTAGASLVLWNDPPTSTQPSRLSSRPGIPHRRFIAVVGVLVEIRATPDSTGVEGEIDANLGGRLFSADLIEYPGGKPPITNPAGQTSVQRFTPGSVGHYTFQLLRPSGGGLVLHVDARS